MKHFPGENERSAEVQASLAEHFDLASRLYRSWSRVRIDDWLAKSALDNNVLHVAMTLNIQAVRLFRSIVEECKRAEGLTGLILSRSLFETSVALDFLLLPAIRLRVVKLHKKDKAGNLKYGAKVGGNRMTPLTREFRANLMLFSASLQEAAKVDELLSVKGLKRFARKEKRKIDPAIIAKIEQEIGPEWCSVLRHKAGYCGLSIWETAKLIGKTSRLWYRVGYPIQCRASHAGDAWKMIENVDGRAYGVAFSTDSDVRLSLYVSTGFFLAILRSLDDHIGFGFKHLINGFDQEATQLYKWPDP